MLKKLQFSRLTYQAIVGLAIAVVVLVNLAIGSVALRLDLSPGQAYTLAPATKTILHNLDDLVNVKLYLSSDLPTRLLPLKNDAVDLIKEYGRLSKQINIKIIDPKKDAPSLSEAKSAGIPELQFSQLEKDKYAVSTAFFGVAVSYGSKTEVIPQITDINSLEYNLTSAIYKVTRKTPVTIGIYGETAGTSQTETLNTLKKVMEQQFVVETTQLPLTTDYQTLLVLALPGEKFSDADINALKTYLSHGGKIVVFADGVTVNEDLTTSPTEHNLFTWLASDGVVLNKDLLLSSAAEMVNFGNGTVQFFAPYPFWLTTTAFNQTQPFFNNVSRLTFPWTSALRLTNPAGWQTSVLVKTENQSWEETSNFSLNPQDISAPANNNFKSFTVAALAQNQKTNGKLVVVASSRFILDRFLSQTSNNLDFTLNLVNDLAAGGALSGIRSRSVSLYPLPTLTATQMDLFKYANILLLPLVLAIFGAYRLMRRR
ncbi:GldG family protein [Patescibacteria group bacterium]|nr:GldG family protein [Patescibacteria group bacterium]MCL5091286.1 GldG family protein [Patescibacteria group bacterium]